MKQIAVEWLVKELQKADYIPKDSLILKYVINQAKEMEKEQQGYSGEEVDFFVKNILHHIKCYEYNVNNLELISFSNDIEFEIEKLYEELKNK